MAYIRNSSAGIIPVVILLALALSACSNPASNSASYMKGHTVSLSYEGPASSETDSLNPFLNYQLLVEFRNEETTQLIRGFYAADGNAANTGAESGNIWRVRFSPDRCGEWSYKASLRTGDSIALSTNPLAGEELTLSNSKGSFDVIESDKSGKDFRARGRLGVRRGYFRFEDTGEYFLKTGSNSPENFLAFEDFDNTYRMEGESREGEAQTSGSIHKYEAHLGDWEPGDPTWSEDRGKAIVGAVNYMASKGMNSIYFLTFNIIGDGKDVWMYTDPNDFTRFDVSKLAQWDILFSHMQSKGIMLHFVLQETENETLLDGGDTGPMRQLYYHELIARFAHHNALVWNLGEENGPNSWSSHGQNDEQRRAMAKFFGENDPYHHPVLLHTLPTKEMRQEILTPLLAYEHLDGLSLQQDHREDVAEVVATWKQKSRETGHEWLITMDEIGQWHTGALPDSSDPGHPTLTRYALWATLMSGGAGVEWYFGARHSHNDLTSEDWRQRDQLWDITNHARSFFEEYLPWWEMEANHSLVNTEGSYCFCKSEKVYVLYIPGGEECKINLSEARGKYLVKWYNPFEGGALQNGSVKTIEGGSWQNPGQPPSDEANDWVILVTNTEL